MKARKFRDSDTVDFVIVGSGAAGGVMARELARAGLSVVVLEQGPRLYPSDYEHDELKNWFLGGLATHPVRNPQTFRRSAAETAVASPVRPNLWYARVVGGSTLHYTANYWRFREVDFRERSLLGEISGTGFADWPISYAELEPYYTKVDWEIGVSGLAGIPGESPRSRPYPMPPLRVKSSGVLFERGAKKMGWNPMPAPMAINSTVFNGRPACVNCGFCHGFACEVLAKASSASTVIPQAEETGHCEVRADSYVSRIETSKKGRATGVAYFDAQGHEHFQRARAVVLAANGGETPRLLLNSANPQFPQGLANSSGLVGKYLMFNYTARVLGVFEHELNEYKSVQVTRILHDFYDSDPKRGFYGGGGLDARIGPQPTLWAQRTAADYPPGWGKAYKERLREFPRSMQISCHTTSLALESNNVTIDPVVKDAWGIPAIRTTYRDHPDDLATARWLQDRGLEILEAAGAQRAAKGPVSESSLGFHLLGTCRMGNDAAKSVVDKYHRSHDIPNLFICDGSSLVTSGRGQPTMTIQALAFRAGEHIARFARRNEI